MPAAVARVAITAPPPPYPFPVPAPVAVQRRSVLRMQVLISSPPRLLAGRSWPAASQSWHKDSCEQERRFRGPSVVVHCAHLQFVSSPALQWLLIPPLSRLCNHPLTSSLPASHSASVGAPLRATGVRSIDPSRAKSPCSHIAGAMPASTRKLTSRQAATMSPALAIAANFQVAVLNVP